MDKPRLAILNFITTVMVLVASVSVIRVLTKGVSTHAGDFHAYWYSGHFIWQGLSPYQAWASQDEIDLPVGYIDGTIQEFGAVRRNNWTVTPANTAPIVLLLSPLSKLSWEVAVRVWAIINLALCVLVTRLLTNVISPARSSKREFVFLLAILLSLVATREVIEYGQTSLLVLASMLLALWMMKRKHPILSGVFLGIAMSKYSLAFPLFLLFLYKGWYPSILTSLITQFIAAATISIITKTSLLELANNYMAIALAHVDLPGYHLMSSMPEQLRDLAPAIVALITAILLLYLIHWYRAGRQTVRSTHNRIALDDLLLLTVGLAWNLVSVYHRRYDSIVMILTVGILTRHLHDSESFSLSIFQKWAITVSMALLTAIWILPVYILMEHQAYRLLFASSNLCTLAVTMYLLPRTRQ